MFHTWQTHFRNLLWGEGLGLLHPPVNHYRCASDWLISGEWVGPLVVTWFVGTRTLSRVLVLWAAGAEGGWRRRQQAPENTRRTTDMFTGRLLSLLALTVCHTAVSAGRQSLSPGEAALEAPARPGGAPETLLSQLAAANVRASRC